MMMVVLIVICSITLFITRVALLKEGIGDRNYRGSMEGPALAAELRDIGPGG